MTQAAGMQKTTPGRKESKNSPKRTSSEAQRLHETTAAICSLLQFALEEDRLDTILERALSLILSISWLSLDSRGCVFLEDEPGVLSMRVQSNLAEPIRQACGRLAYGRCLCGRAAATQETVFSSCLDDRHDVSYDGMAQHGHYCVPIVYRHKTLGVINLYVNAGHRRVPYEEQFLKAIADSLAGIIKRNWTEQQLVKSNADLRKAVMATIHVIVSTLELRDPYTAGHQRKVADIAHAIATKMGLPEDQIETVRMAASVHDLGKIAVPTEILSKPGPMTEPEFSMIRTHPEIGYDILKGIDFPWPIAQVILQHHERMDGSGYPFGLRGDEILLEARILAVADVCEAMCSHRPYRAALGMDTALAEITEHSGDRYDADVVQALLRAFSDESGPLAQAA